MEPENTGPLEEEHHLPRPIIFRFQLLIFGGVFAILSWDPNDHGENFIGLLKIFGLEFAGRSDTVDVSEIPKCTTWDGAKTL